jgi:hypothetical protein
MESNVRQILSSPALVAEAEGEYAPFFGSAEIDSAEYGNSSCVNSPPD